jgi:hypothetical protein
MAYTPSTITPTAYATLYLCVYERTLHLNHHVVLVLFFLCSGISPLVGYRTSCRSIRRRIVCGTKGDWVFQIVIVMRMSTHPKLYRIDKQTSQICRKVRGMLHGGCVMRQNNDFRATLFCLLDLVGQPYPVDGMLLVGDSGSELSGLCSVAFMVIIEQLLCN